MAVTKMAQIVASKVIVGVDTHKDVHVAAAKDQLGRLLGDVEIPTTPDGYESLLMWAAGFGQVELWGIEGTGSYGAGLSRFLRSAGQTVVEVNRPDRAARRRHGKSDTVDARAAAAAVGSGDATAVPKNGDDLVEAIRVLRVARGTAMRARTQTINALKALVVTAPDQLRAGLRNLSRARLAAVTARFRPPPPIDAASANRWAMRSLGQRYEALSAEISLLDIHLAELTARAAPQLVAKFGVGPDSAGALLAAAGGNSERLRSSSAFAKLCGVAPLEASSGQTVRHRLNRGGNREANSALYRIVLVRLRWHQPTIAYVKRRTAEGKTKKEIIRCLKRYVAREVYLCLRPTLINTA
jgi:transposase